MKMNDAPVSHYGQSLGSWKMPTAAGAQETGHRGRQHSSASGTSGAYGDRNSMRGGTSPAAPVPASPYSTPLPLRPPQHNAPTAASFGQGRAPPPPQQRTSPAHAPGRNAYRSQSAQNFPGGNQSMSSLQSLGQARDGSKELRRREGSPAYVAAQKMRGGDWNRDADLSQRELNDKIYKERMQEKTQNAVWKRVREGAWDDSGANEFRDREGKAVPIRPMSGLLPLDSGTADPVMAYRLKNKAGSSFVPKLNEWNITGRAADERNLTRVFRSFDVNYDGQLQINEFRAALRYLGTTDIDHLIARLDPDGTGLIAYADALSALEVKKPNSADFKSGRIHAEAVHVGTKPVPSNAGDMDGELGKTAYSSLPWASAGLRQQQSSMSPLLKSQMSKALSGNVSYEDRDSLGSLEMLQEKLRDGKRGSSTRLKAALRQADLDRDGSLSYEDFVRTLKTSLGIVLTKDEMKELSRHFDASGKGQIDYYMLTDVLSKTDPEIKDSYADMEYQRLREDMICKLRDAIRGKMHRIIAIYRRFDSENSGQISIESLIDGLFQIGVQLNGEETKIIQTLLGENRVNNKVFYQSFVQQFDMPTRAHDSSLGLGMLPQTDAEDAEFLRRNKQTVYQKSGNQASYDYLNSGFLTKDQRRGKTIMQKFVHKIASLENDFHRSLKMLYNRLLTKDIDGDGSILLGDFDETIKRTVRCDDEDIDFLLVKLGAKSSGKVNLYDFYNLCRHESNEVKQRPHLSSQIGVYNGSLNIGYSDQHNSINETGRRIFHDFEAMKDHNRSGMLDHYDHCGRTNDGRSTGIGDTLDSSWVPKTQFDVKMMRKMGDVVSSCRGDLQKRMEALDRNQSGTVTVDQFAHAIKHSCAHMFRSVESSWVLRKITEMKSEGVRYGAFFDALDSYKSSFDNERNAETFDSWQGVGDRTLMTKLHESSGVKPPKPNGLTQSPTVTRTSDSPPPRVDPWGRPLVIDGLSKPMRTAEQRRFEKYGNHGGHSGKVVYETDQSKDDTVISSRGSTTRSTRLW